MSGARPSSSCGSKKSDVSVVADQSEESEKSKKLYMDLLSKYNEIRDAAQVVIGAIANIEGTTVKKIHEKFELPLND